MQLQLITPEKIFFDGAIASVQVPGSEGEFGVLPGHAPFISSLKAGLVTIIAASGETKKVFVTGGIAEVTPEKCTLLAEKAEETSSLSEAELAAKIAAAA